MKAPFRQLVPGIAFAILLISTCAASAFYNPAVGKWISRDPIGEKGGQNINTFVHNDGVNFTDAQGLWETEVHHDIVNSWLPAVIYEDFAWRCCHINVRSLIKDGSDAVDGVNGHFFSFFSAQSAQNAYQHAMKSPGQGEDEARVQWQQFIDGHLNQARQLANDARKIPCCRPDQTKGNPFPRAAACVMIADALGHIGRAFHAFSDESSPSHSGFQTWPGLFGIPNFWDFVGAHTAAETFNVFIQNGYKDPVVNSVQGEFQGVVEDVLKSN